MASAPQFLVGYGFTQALSNLAIIPIQAKRDPTTADKAQVGTIWVNVTTNAPWIITSVANNLANWLLLEVGGGAGNFTSLTVNPGNATITAGNLAVTAGSITAGTTITAGTGITATTGNITATLNDIVATAGAVRANVGGFVSSGGDANVATVVITGDTGAPNVGNLQISNVVNTTQGAGVGTILTTTGASHNNTGFIKFYVGATPVFVPYFATI